MVQILKSASSICESWNCPLMSVSIKIKSLILHIFKSNDTVGWTFLFSKFSFHSHYLATCTIPLPSVFRCYKSPFILQFNVWWSIWLCTHAKMAHQTPLRKVLPKEEEKVKILGKRIWSQKEGKWRKKWNRRAKEKWTVKQGSKINENRRNGESPDTRITKVRVLGSYEFKFGKIIYPPLPMLFLLLYLCF